MHGDIGDITALSSGQASVLQDFVLPLTLAALARMFRVLKPVVGPLKLPRDCNLAFQNGGQTICNTVAKPTCNGALPQGQNLDHFGDYQLCKQPGNCQDVTGGPGVDAVDFILYVTSTQSSNCVGSTLAYANYCQRDTENWYGLPNRPLSGFINFCPDSIPESSSDGQRLVDIAFHEILHTLFFAPDHFEVFIDGAGNPLSSVVVDNTIVTPKVANVTQARFACASAVGAPLENNGGQGTAGSHWEATALQGEMMIGSSSGTVRAVLSEITLALAEDSGWYGANYARAGFLRYGFHSGCDLLAARDTCTMTSPASQQYFCSGDYSTTRCVDGVTQARCAQTPLFSPCVEAQALSNGDCTDPANLLLTFRKDPGIGMVYGSLSMCLGIPGGSLTRGVNQVGTDAGCWPTKCSNGQLSVLVQKSLTSSKFSEVACPPGGYISLGLSDGYGAGTRLGPCPDPSEVCPFQGCPVNSANGLLCSANGNCFGTCHCAVDSTGDDCSGTLCQTSADCPADSLCSSTKECVYNGVAPPPPPPAVIDPTKTYSAAVAAQDPLRAVHTGYLRSCSFFEDLNNNGQANEGATVSGVLGDLPDLATGTADSRAPIVQDVTALGAACVDTFTKNAAPAMQIRSTAGTPYQNAIVDPLSTLAYLRTVQLNATAAQGADNTTSDSFAPQSATTDVLGLLGLTATSLNTPDWLSVLSTYKDGDNTAALAAKETMLASLRVVNGAEIAAYFLAGSSGTAQTDLRAAADTYLYALMDTLRQLSSNQTAAVKGSAALSDAGTVSAILAAALQGNNSADAGSLSAVAAAIALVNTRLGASSAALGFDLLVDWAKVSLVAQMQYARSAAALAGDPSLLPAFRANTTEAELNARAQAAQVDVADGTKAGDDFSSSNIVEKGKAWLRKESGPLPNWAWIAIACGVLALLLCASVNCRRRKPRTARQAAVYGRSAAPQSAYPPPSSTLQSAYPSHPQSDYPQQYPQQLPPSYAPHNGSIRPQQGAVAVPVRQGGYNDDGWPAYDPKNYR